jgi:hypothetical protein
METLMLERRRGRGRPRKSEEESLGPGRYVRFPLKLDAAVEAVRVTMQDELRAKGLPADVEISEAIRRLVRKGAEAEGLIEPEPEEDKSQQPDEPPPAPAKARPRRK